MQSKRDGYTLFSCWCVCVLAKSLGILRSTLELQVGRWASALQRITRPPRCKITLTKGPCCGQCCDDFPTKFFAKWCGLAMSITRLNPKPWSEKRKINLFVLPVGCHVTSFSTIRDIGVIYFAPKRSVIDFCCPDPPSHTRKPKHWRTAAAIHGMLSLFLNSGGKKWGPQIYANCLCVLNKASADFNC